ncbi:MAG: cysteine-rich CWC family protein [Gemmatimonadota bacterium]
MSNASVDLSRCPICGAPNACTMVSPEQARDCWCYTAEIDEAVMDRVPKEKRGIVCVCARCAAGGSA